MSVVAVAPRPLELTSFNQAELFMDYLKHADLSKFEIKKAFADTQVVCLLYEMNYRELPVTTFCMWIVSPR